MGLADKIRADAKKAGASKGKIIYFREGEKVRVRFLTDFDEGEEIEFHDSFSAGVNVPCQENFGRSCDYCDQEGLRTRSMYAWSVWDYDAKEVKVFLFAVNSNSPIPALLSMNDTYGTVTDRDYMITRTGKGTNTAYAVVPMDKVKFRNDKAKPMTKSKLLAVLDKAYPADGAEDEDDIEDDKPKVKKGKSKPAAKAKAKPAPEPDYDDDDSDWTDDEDAQSYTEMTAKELYTLCKQRDIEVAPKKSEKYYIRLLEEMDRQEDDWADGEEDDEWGEDEEE